MPNLEEQIQAILERNKRVEADKEWETSWFRRILISVITYVSACTFLLTTGEEHTRAYLSAFVPTIGYFLSSISLGPIKKRWIEKYREIS